MRLDYKFNGTAFTTFECNDWWSDYISIGQSIMLAKDKLCNTWDVIGNSFIIKPVELLTPRCYIPLLSIRLIKQGQRCPTKNIYLDYELWREKKIMSIV